MKKEINVFDYAEEILKALPKGILIVSEAEDCVNAMTIGWGHLGIEWGVPTFSVCIRESRFTYELLERTGEFTICIPRGENISDKVKKTLALCGSKSGRDVDKIAQSKLTLIDADAVQPPAIKEFPLTLECRVVYSELQEVKKISSKFTKKFYQSGDAHKVYCGEILKAYIIED